MGSDVLGINVAASVQYAFGYILRSPVVAKEEVHSSLALSWRSAYGLYLVAWGATVDTLCISCLSIVKVVVGLLLCQR
jgi:hypothetical protein